MCLAIPGKVISMAKEGILRVGTVSFAGLEREIGFVFVPEAKPGDFVLVHVGYAIAVLDLEEAERTLNLLDELHEKVSQL